MNTNDVQTLVLSSLQSYGQVVLVILGAFLVIGVGYCVYKFGASQLGIHSNGGVPGFIDLGYAIYSDPSNEKLTKKKARIHSGGKGSVYASFNEDDSDFTYVGEGKRMGGKWRLD